MDFISNLIKRPISLVLNDSSSSSATEHSQSPTKLVADLAAVSQSSSTSASTSLSSPNTTIRISPDRSATPSSSFLIGSIGSGSGSSLFAAAMNTSINANITGDLVADNIEDYCDLPPPVRPLVDIEPTRTSPVNNNSSAIGELLLQINNNLNLAESLTNNPTTNDRNLISATAAAHSSSSAETTPIKMTPPTVPPPIITTTPNNNITKIEENKSATPTATTPSIDIATNNPSTTPLKLNSPKQESQTNNSFVIEKPLELDFNGVTSVFAQKFSGLAAFDEQNIPDLPDALSSDLEGDRNNKLHLLVNDTDTALSSDNETYVECQSYQEDLLENTVNDLTNDLATEISGSERYRSALNTTSGENSLEAEGILNNTMENVPDIKLDEEKMTNSLNLTLTPEKSPGPTIEQVVFEDEPMDVDISYTEIEQDPLETNKTSVIEDHLTPFKECFAATESPVINESATNEENTQQSNEVRGKSTCTISADELNSSKKRLTFTLLGPENEAYASAESTSELDTEQSTYEVTQNKSIELSKNQLFNLTMSPDKGNLMSPTLKLPAIVESDSKNAAVEKEAKENLHMNDENIPSNMDEIDNLNVSVKSAGNVESNLNSTMDMNSSCGSLKSTSSSNSSSFPLTTNNEDFKQFPRSPKSAEIEKKPRFLEKSEYAEQLNCRKISITELKLSPNAATSTTSNKSDEEKQISMTEQSVEVDVLNKTNDNSLNIAESAPKSEVHKLDKPRRDTFFVSPAHSKPVTDFPSPLIVNSDDGTENVTLETMDIDETLPMVDEESSSPGLPVTEPLVVHIPTSAATPPSSCSPSAIPTRTTPTKEAETKIPVLPARSPPLPTLMKRPPIHAPYGRSKILEMLSAKEQTQSNNRDEKDEVAEKLCTPSPMDDLLASSTLGECFTGFGSNTEDAAFQQEFTDDDFRSNNNLVLNPCDFDFLLTKGNNNVQDAHVDRSSLLLRFDPLLGVPVPVKQTQHQHQLQQEYQHQLFANNNIVSLSPTIEEDVEEQSLTENNSRSFVVDSAKIKREQQLAASILPTRGSTSGVQQNKRQLITQKQQQQQPLLPAIKPKKNVRMSVDIIESNDCNKTFEHNNSTDENQSNYKMDELEKKIKNEVLKTEDIEKKLKEGEQREEALIKRITEKDKTISKMNGVVEAYEKAIAELIAEKEQLKQNVEKQVTELTADRDMNYHHLTSLETTFSDLHVKYEKSKEMTLHLKSNEELLLTEKRKILENLRAQEQRYDKMKNHAMQQLEIANRKLESMSREHSVEVTKLKASLKKEEISRASINEQLQQKSRENAELVKICDELINGQGS